MVINSRGYQIYNIISYLTSFHTSGVLGFWGIPGMREKMYCVGTGLVEVVRMMYTKDDIMEMLTEFTDFSKLAALSSCDLSLRDMEN